MQISREQIIISVISLTAVFLVVGVFILLYVSLYNQRKKKYAQDKVIMQQLFEKELVQTQLEVQEQTFKTIAADIHDNIGQILSTLKLTLSSIDIDNNAGKAKEKVVNATNLTDISINELRSLASVLHAENLLAEGLEHALQHELVWISKSERLTIDYLVEGEKQHQLQPQRELIAFRILQELLNNILKHAYASKIKVRWLYNADHVKIVISDNGKGFDKEEIIGKKQGLGMQTLLNRAALINADLNILSKENEGTNAIILIPYNLI